MTWFLNFLYVAILVCGSPWMLWRYSKGKNQRGWTQKLFGNIHPVFDSQSENAHPPKRIWFHAVSVGEVNLLGPVLKEIRKIQPNVEIAISTTTETGFDLASQKHTDCFVFFCPFDFSWAIKRVLKRLRPDSLILVELEMWPNLISVTRSQGIPVIVMNGRLSEKSQRGYQRVRWLLASVFQKLSLVLCQNEVYANRFIEVGCEADKISVNGNVKFDGVQTNRLNPSTQKLIELAGIKSADKIFVAGSTQAEEDLMAAKAFQAVAKGQPELRLILVPRHPDRVGALVGQLKKLGLKTRLRSEISIADNDSANVANLANQNGPWKQDEVLIVDVIGELGGWWGVAGVAYVGGSMGTRGGQNMIEPAGYGIPLCFGPNTWNFRQIVEQLKESDACREVHSLDDMTQFLEWSLCQNKDASEMGQRAQKVVLGHLGASQRTAESLWQVIAAVNGNALKSGADSAHTKAA